MEVLGFELTSLFLLGRCYNSWTMPPTQFFVSYFLEEVLHFCRVQFQTVILPSKASCLAETSDAYHMLGLWIDMEKTETATGNHRKKSLKTWAQATTFWDHSEKDKPSSALGQNKWREGEREKGEGKADGAEYDRSILYVCENSTIKPTKIKYGRGEMRLKKD